jgi:two-component system chemotaxis response regulator CheB
MAEHDVIVIGASSGGVQPLSLIARSLPEDLGAAVFVVLHVPPDSPSQLPAILNRAGRLPAAHAVDGEPIRRGRIYVAPPGLQTYIDQGRIRVQRGPRENNHRPAIDPLFRTAAHYYGPRVIGVVLSGALDDGSAGLLAVKKGGGIAVVQEPADATVPDMPTHALEVVAVDHRAAAEMLGPLLAGLIRTDDEPGRLPAEVPLETVEEAPNAANAKRSDELGGPSSFTCPDCQGTLFEIDDAGILRFRCRVGHGYSAETMLDAQGDSVERALWTALRALEERSALMRKLAERARRRGHGAVAGMFEARGGRVEEDVRAVHDLIMTGRTLEPVRGDGG